MPVHTAVRNATRLAALLPWLVALAGCSADSMSTAPRAGTGELHGVVIFTRFYIDTAALAPSRAASLAGPALFAALRSASLRPPEIWRINPDGSGAALVTQGAIAYPDPTGRRIAYDPWSGTSTAILDLLTGESHPLDLGPGYNRLWHWSPDGSHLAFTSDRSGQFQVYTAKSDGSGVLRISHSDLQELGILWSLDGGHLILTRSSADFTSNRIIDLTTSSGAEVTLADSADFDAGTFDISRDGQAILFNSIAAGRNDFWMMSRDGSHKRNLTSWDSMHNHNWGVWSPDRSQIIVDADGSLLRADTSGHLMDTLTTPQADRLDLVTAWIP